MSVRHRATRGEISRNLLRRVKPRTRSRRRGPDHEQGATGVKIYGNLLTIENIELRLQRHLIHRKKVATDMRAVAIC
jgi:hypothetical protein